MPTDHADAPGNPKTTDRVKLSSGVNEGRITVKLQKRIMGGRAGIPCSGNESY
ncbi:hypothetical protein [Streptomyces sp. SDr-06]|uniref:hypothetical protein n=1 Tax=Streptomyces sp. SDr-06 TaxID=2267702 RepID=UPI001CB94E41|nr:hypothetical protein [Streptomyces sp. SDr-06]